MAKLSSKLVGLLIAATATFGASAALGSYSDGVAAFHSISLEAGIRFWRKAAWQEGDFQSEIRLADIYANPADSHYYDPVEAYVWYFLASRSHIDAHDEDAASSFLRNARRRAHAKRGIILTNLDTQQRNDARERIVYILSCRGSAGFIELGRIHDTSRNRNNGSFWHGFDPDDEDYVGIASDSVMEPSDADALLYFHIAESMGDPMARFYLDDAEGRLRGSPIGRHIIEEEAKKFHSWAPAYEFYPPGDNDSGIPYSDECPANFERERALSLVPSQLPRFAIKHALAFLGWDREGIKGVQRFQLTIGDDATGILTAAESVRLIQTAAVQGDADSQNTLGVMYAKGIGVVRNFVRAQYWFQKASDQRYGAALYHMGVLYKVGPQGIQQNLSRANDCFTAAAAAGFKPAMNQLEELLEHAANGPPRSGQL